MIEQVTIRRELPADQDAVRKINEAAFNRSAEATLVDSLRYADPRNISLVALVEGVVVGHIFFSSVQIQGTACSRSGLGLAPIAVDPPMQHRGIGSKLILSGLEACRRDGHRIVVVLGHPGYYPRFGFLPASRFGIRSEYDVPDDAFMVLELVPGALRDCAGTVKYHPAFHDV